MTAIGKIPNDNPMANMPKERRIGDQELTKDDFMKIMITQMKNQDPFKPYDSAAMLQNMAQLSQLSASDELKKSITNLSTNISRSEMVGSIQLVGHGVQVLSKVAPLIAGKGLSGSVIVPKQANNVTIEIKDPSGKVVKTVQKGDSGRGVLDFDWDGKDDKGVELPAEFYTITGTATIDGAKTTLMSAGTFKVGSVALDQSTNKVILNVDGLGGLTMDDILKVL